MIMLPMRRMFTLTCLGLAAMACGEAADDGLPEARVVITDSLGTIPSGMVPSPDGSRLAFARTESGRSAIWVANADGSGERRLTSGVWDMIPWWSPDGKWIAYHAESPGFDVFVVSVDGGEPRQLTSGPGQDFPRGWLPDGSGVIVTRNGVGDSHTLLVKLDGSPPTRLGPVMPGDQHASPSPDGTLMGFDLHQGATPGTVWVQDLAGTEPARQLTTENFEFAQQGYMWSPDGRELAYTSGRTGTTDIWVVDATTGESRQVTTDVRNDHNPRWSPDGKWIAFLSDRGGQTDLWVAPSAGGPARRVTSDVEVEAFPVWSPDGQALYFARNQVSVQVQALPVDGGAPRTLLDWPNYAIEFAASLSPDGTTLLFTSNRSGNRDIWSLPVAGGEPAPFIAAPSADYDPRYSPDGRQVLFTSDRAGSVDLWVVPATGGEPSRLTNDRAVETEAAWSPDGTRVVYVAAGELRMVSASGGEPVLLSREASQVRLPQWSPDGRFIYFIGAAAGGLAQYRIPSEGGPIENLGARKTIGFSQLSPDGLWIAYSAFEGGWAFQELLSTAGGAPRRLSPDTTNVFQPVSFWAPDGRSLVVHALDLQSNRDATDVFLVQMPEGTWRPLTRTPAIGEAGFAITPDGRELLTQAFSARVSLMRADVSRLLMETAAPRR